SHTICFPSDNTGHDSNSNCKIVFDFPNWRGFFKRRRELLQQQSSSNEEQQMAVADKAPEQHTEAPIQPEWLVKITNGTHSCFTDCEFPSECFFKIALERICKRSNQPSSSPSSSPSLFSQSTTGKLPKTAKRAKKYKSRDSKSFQKVPSPLGQEWNVDNASDEEVNRDADNSQRGIF
ncbi:hypothetical protein LI328DRAFT_165531, partial [Trichoderma asperelloides]